MDVVHTKAELARALSRGGERRGVVMTMGALHAGHLALVSRATELADDVVVTIFVNPLQFGPSEDFAAYPRTLETDLAALSGRGVRLVFAPSPVEMYPAGTPTVQVVPPSPLATTYEGALRPGHFAGVLTVVAKLLHLTRPNVALFGQKDAQQLAAVRRMVRDLDMPVEIEAVPIVRDADDLALSSRNAYLSATDRAHALALPRAIRAGVAAWDEGRDPDDVRRVALAELAAAQGVDLDYVDVVDADVFAPLTSEPTGHPVLIAAVRVGATRLLDNAPLASRPLTSRP